MVTVTVRFGVGTTDTHTLIEVMTRVRVVIPARRIWPKPWKTVTGALG